MQSLWWKAHSPATDTPRPEMISAAAPKGSDSTEQVLMLLTMVALGRLLQSRFPDKQPDVIEKLLLQFVFPASLFQGLSHLSLKLSQLGFIAGGIFLVMARMFASVVVSRACLGSSSQPERAALRRTAVFQFATSSYALSVMPFVSEFIGGSLVGLGSLVDLSMKFYMLIIMPVLLQLNREKQKGPAGEAGPSKKETLKKLATDPIMLSLIFGVAAAAVTEGRGCAAMGFLGRVIKSLAGAQTPVLFVLIGLKLKFDSDNPLFSLILLFASQGILLCLAALLCSAITMSVPMQQFICFFAQGAPSVVGLGLISSAVNGGAKGYNVEFAFDIIALACPLSAIFQCIAGMFGPSYPSLAGYIGVGFLAISGLLRFVFRRKFALPAGDELDPIEPQNELEIGA